MWLPFSRFYIFLFCLIVTVNAHAEIDTSSVNPIFRDSILKNKIDTLKWNKLVNTLDKNRPSNSIINIQSLKQPRASLIFLYITSVILIILVILKTIFDDYTQALLEGLLSLKKFYIFYKSKKYDSLFAVLTIYFLKIIILSMVTYIGLNYFNKNNFSVFQTDKFLKILLLLVVFFSIKNIIESIFNWVIGTQDPYRALFLQNLFAELILSTTLLIIFMTYIYNSRLSSGLMTILLTANISAYLFFNIIRSYQLISINSIKYKFHFFLYICAFKVLPFLVLIKYMLNNIV